MYRVYAGISRALAILSSISSVDRAGVMHRKWTDVLPCDNANHVTILPRIRHEWLPSKDVARDEHEVGSGKFAAIRCWLPYLK